MILLDARKQRHGVFADLLYSDVQSDEELVPQPAAREESNRKLAELKIKQAAMQTASIDNWSDKLAMFNQ